MKYLSARNKNIEVSGTDAIIKGISDDGGLFVPEKLPKINLENLIDLSYEELAVEIISLFFPEISKERLKKIVKNYEVFEIDEPVSIKSFNDISFLELYHGPTASFKDMALTLLPGLMKASYDINKLDEKIFVLVATSGDTGSAALEGFGKEKDLGIAVFYPNGGVSEIQMLQMEQGASENAYVYSIIGNFDDAQRSVKEIFVDENIKKLEEKFKINLSSANSINIGRLVPQIVYYFYAYFKLVKDNVIDFGEKIDVAVPTGNFGNILASIYGKKMGLPFENIICSSNENDVLYDFIKTKRYNKNRDFKKTLSPSMDILVSSNLERFLYLITDGDNEYIKNIFRKLKEKGEFSFDREFPEFLKGQKINDEDTKKLIGEVFEELGYLIDPHTAVAYGASKISENHKLIVSTASPFKFSKTVLDGIGIDNSQMNLKDRIKKLEEIGNLKAPKSISEKLEEKIKPKYKIEIDEIKKEVERLLEEGL